MGHSPDQGGWYDSEACSQQETKPGKPGQCRGIDAAEHCKCNANTQHLHKGYTRKHGTCTQTHRHKKQPYTAINNSEFI